MYLDACIHDMRFEHVLKVRVYCHEEKPPHSRLLFVMFCRCHCHSFLSPLTFLCAPRGTVRFFSVAVSLVHQTTSPSDPSVSFCFPLLLFHVGRLFLPLLSATHILSLSALCRLCGLLQRTGPHHRYTLHLSILDLTLRTRFLVLLTKR